VPRPELDAAWLAAHAEPFSACAHAMIESHTYSPGPPLSRYVESLWFRRGFASDRKREYSLPTGCVDLVFNLHEERIRFFVDPLDSAGTTVNGAIVHGAQSRSFILDARKHIHVVGVHFRPGGGGLLGLPGAAIANEHIALQDIWGARAQELREQLLACKSPSATFAVLEQALLHGLPSIPRVHPVVSVATRSLTHSDRISRVAAVQQASGYSERRFTDLFTQAVGLSPKTFARLQRMSAVAHHLASSLDCLAQVAAANGYFDQAHLARDFRELVGMPPSRYKPSRHPLHMELAEGSG
jgi:AraC-like DNA-binding protein